MKAAPESPVGGGVGRRRHCLVCGSPDSDFFSSAFDRVLQTPQVLWEVRRCRRCGFGWTDPPLPREQIAAYYPESYLGETEKTLEEFLSGRLQRSRSWRRETEKVRLVERFCREGRILDVGCGDAKFLWALSAARWERHGVEMAARTVHLVRSRLPELHLQEGDIFSRHLEERSFDVLTFWHVLEHLPGPRRVLERAARLLKPEGWIFISLPNLESLQARLFRRHWYPFDDVPRHLYHFSPRSLEILLEGAGFRLQRHLFFSRLVNFHSLKYSLIHASESRFGSRLPYYLLKPLLWKMQLLEGITGRYGILTTVARRAAEKA